MIVLERCGCGTEYVPIAGIVQRHCPRCGAHSCTTAVGDPRELCGRCRPVAPTRAGRVPQACISCRGLGRIGGRACPLCRATEA